MIKWIVPCNPKYYNVTGAFEKFDRIDWKQSNKNIQPDDIVYIYVGKPVQAIIYKCKVNKVNLSAVEIDDSEFIIDGTNYAKYERHMELEFIKKYDKSVFSFEKMKEYGVKGRIQGPRKVNPEFSAYLETIE